MLNQIVLVGRIRKISDIKNIDGKEIVRIKLDVKQNETSKSENISCIAPLSIETKLIENCQINDLIGIKGHIECPRGVNNIIVEKITCLVNN